MAASYVERQGRIKILWCPKHLIVKVPPIIIRYTNTIVCTLYGVKTLRTQDTSDPRHFVTSAKVSIRHFGTSAKLSGHYSAEISWDTSALTEVLRHCATPDGKVDECLRNSVN